MKVTLAWLKEFVPYEGTASQAAEVFERLGFEVSSVQDFSGSISNVVTAEIRETARHPNADRLSLCTVWDGQQEFSVVCGAPNVKAGSHVAFARLGAKLPGGLEIKAAKIRGVESKGMICSKSELGLEEKSEGILLLEGRPPAGQDIKTVLGLDDAVLDMDVTPNRRDALSVLGLARELAAGTGLSLKSPEPRVREIDLTCPMALTNDALDLCARYTARLIRDIRIAPSPEWMRRRLTLCGIRSINNVVDITNYVLLELGQPLHAFDAAKMKGRQVRVRRARAGESLVLLDGRSVGLSEGMLIIADEERPAALAGIMGGQESAVSDRTEEIILESAAFDPAHIRSNAKALATHSESSYRFERGSDWSMVALASRRAAQLMQELANGLSYMPMEASSAPPVSPTIKLHTERIRQLLGLEIKESLAADYLRKLGCVINTGVGQHAVTVPPWRLDLTMEADLLEEIARLHGYDQIPQQMPHWRATAVPEDKQWPFDRALAERLAGMGFLEACNTSFLNAAQGAPFSPGFGQPGEARAVRVSNPLSLDQALLRPSLLPALLQSAAFNFRRQIPAVQLFELGRVFYEMPQNRYEALHGALVLGGEVKPAHWRQKRRAGDFHDLVGVIHALLNALHIPDVRMLAHRISIFHPKRSAILLTGGTALGWLGELHPDLLESLDLPQGMAGCEFDTELLRKATPAVLTFRAASAYPPVTRDLSFVVESKTSYEVVERTVRFGAGDLLEHVGLIDLYQGDKIGSGKKSMTLSLLFRHAERTLSDAEIERIMERLMADLGQKCGAVLRK